MTQTLRGELTLGVAMPPFLYHPMLPLAQNALEKMGETSLLVWLKFGLLIAAFLVGAIILRKIMQINRFILLAIFIVGSSIVLLNWTYNRTEPKILSPMIDAIAPFLPGGKGLEAPKVDPNNPTKPVRK